MKQNGRKQAMTNTFNRLLTTPQEYTPESHLAYYGHIENCELCGAALDYSFKLVHFSDPKFEEGKSLHVGSDCIVNFAETYVPSLARQILINVKKAVETTKIGQFRKNNPTIFEDMKMINQKISEYKRIYGWYFARLKELENFRQSYKNLNRREYLSKPQVDKFYSLKKKIDEGKLDQILNDHKNKDQNLKFLDDSDKSFLKLFDKYKEKVNYRLYDNSIAYSKLEKQFFVDKVKDYKNKQKKATFKKSA